MRRYLAVLVLGALVLASPVAAKVINVTNPMNADLDAAQHNIYNVGSVDALSGFVRANQFYVFDGFAAYAWVGGSADPNVAGLTANHGSLYSRRVDATHGELWVNVGPGDADWVRVAP